MKLAIALIAVALPFAAYANDAQYIKLLQQDGYSKAEAIKITQTRFGKPVAKPVLKHTAKSAHKHAIPAEAMDDDFEEIPATTAVGLNSDAEILREARAEVAKDPKLAAKFKAIEDRRANATGNDKILLDEGIWDDSEIKGRVETLRLQAQTPGLPESEKHNMLQRAQRLDDIRLRRVWGLERAGDGKSVTAAVIEDGKYTGENRHVEGIILNSTKSVK